MIALLPTLFAAVEEPEGIAALGLDPLAILAQAVTFLVAFWIIKRFALEKIVKTLEDRRKTIDKGVLLGREMEAEKAKLDERVAEALKKARLEADKIIQQANQEGGQLIKAAEEKAAKKMETMVADAHAKIEDDLSRARKDLEAEMLALVADATEAIIDEKLDTQKDNALIARALSGVRR
jgi:F-type H+-transporting ATPase subunit b